MLRQTWLEIYTENLRLNYREVKRLIPENCEIIAVVKSNAYSHGAVKTAQILESEGCNWFAVATPEEALELRQKGISGKILVLTASPKEAAEEYIKEDIHSSCGDFLFLEHMNRTALSMGKKAKIHLKFDTGLSRTGFQGRELSQLCDLLDRSQGISIHGAYSHFATADEENPAYTRWQFSRFTDFMAILEKRGYSIDFKHICNSPGIVNFPEYCLDAVRPGNLLYGLPSGRRSREIHIRPTCSFKTKIALIRNLEPRTGVGYGLKYMTRGEERTGILPVGFYDGMSRLLSGRAEVIVRGKRAPVIGNICLDQTIINLESVPEAEEGDEVVLFGRQEEEEITIKEIADSLDTIVTQVLSFVTSRVPRIYI